MLPLRPFVRMKWRFILVDVPERDLGILAPRVLRERADAEASRDNIRSGQGETSGVLLA